MGDAPAAAARFFDGGAAFGEAGEHHADVFRVQRDPFSDRGYGGVVQEGECDERVSGASFELAEDAGPLRGEGFQGEVESLRDRFIGDAFAAVAQEDVVGAGAQELEPMRVAPGVLKHELQRVVVDPAAGSFVACFEEGGGFPASEGVEAGDPDPRGSEQGGEVGLQAGGKVVREAGEVGAAGAGEIVEGGEDRGGETGEPMGAFQDDQGSAGDFCEGFVEGANDLLGSFRRTIFELAREFG